MTLRLHYNTLFSWYVCLSKALLMTWYGTALLLEKYEIVYSRILNWGLFSYTKKRKPLHSIIDAPPLSFLYLAFCLYLALDMLVHMGVRWVQERVPHADRIFRSLDATIFEDRRNILEDTSYGQPPMSYSTLAEKMDQWVEPNFKSFARKLSSAQLSDYWIAEHCL